DRRSAGARGERAAERPTSGGRAPRARAEPRAVERARAARAAEPLLRGGPAARGREPDRRPRSADRRFRAGRGERRRLPLSARAPLAVDRQARVRGPRRPAAPPPAAPLRSRPDALAVVSFRVEPGRRFPSGASATETGVDSSVLSRHATRA